MTNITKHYTKQKWESYCCKERWIGLSVFCDSISFNDLLCWSGVRIFLKISRFLTTSSWNLLWIRDDMRWYELMDDGIIFLKMSNIIWYLQIQYIWRKFLLVKSFCKDPSSKTSLNGINWTKLYPRLILKIDLSNYDSFACL